jgi:hypothetical protein
MTAKLHPVGESYSAHFLKGIGSALDEFYSMTVIRMRK